MKQELRHLLLVIFFCGGIYLLSRVNNQESLINDKVKKILTTPKKPNYSNSTKPNQIAGYKLEYCNCRRTIQRSNRNLKTEFFQTTCGQDAYKRGTNQKVVSFSFYGNTASKDHQKRKYFQGIKENLVAMVALYGPDWTMRLYVDLKLSDPVLAKLCHLACQNPNLDLCLAAHLPGSPVGDARELFPMLWRFFPTLDPQVDILLSRDLDSLIEKREVSAVTEWLKSGKLIHSMRDHPQHCVPLLGGMWGARLSVDRVRQQWQKSWKKIQEHRLAHSPRNATGPDQILLQHAIWKWGRHDALEHDSYSCKEFPNSVGFPTERKSEKRGNFVGGRADFWQECPMQCRRKGHHDWKYC